MDKIQEIKQMRKLKYLFFVFIFVSLIGVALTIVDIQSSLGPAIIMLGVLVGVLCAFTPCPCCSKPSGFFFYYFIGGVVPVGVCIH
ncbi:MAG: hypothetical protein PVJ39_07385, partial [Gammaproteobacteria bacterium]